MGCLHLLLSPNQITNLTDLLNALCIETGNMRTLDDLNAIQIEEQCKLQFIHNTAFQRDLYKTYQSGRPSLHHFIYKLHWFMFKKCTFEFLSE